MHPFFGSCRSLPRRPLAQARAPGNSVRQPTSRAGPSGRWIEIRRRTAVSSPGRARIRGTRGSAIWGSSVTQYRLSRIVSSEFSSAVSSPVVARWPRIGYTDPSPTRHRCGTSTATWSWHRGSTATGAAMAEGTSNRGQFPRGTAGTSVIRIADLVGRAGQAGHLGGAVTQQRACSSCPPPSLH